MSATPVVGRSRPWIPPSRRALSGSKARRIVFYLIGIAAFATVWEVGALAFARVNPLADQIFPTWEVIFTTSISEFGIFGPHGVPSYPDAIQVLARHSLDTALRVIGGMAIGVATGVGCGLLMAYSVPVRRLVSAPIQLLRSVPLLALIPLFILWFGGQPIGIYLYIAFAVFVMVVVGTYHAALGVRPAHARFARTLGGSRVQVFRDVVIPGMLPELFATIRVVSALAWSFALGAEFTGAQSGLGYLLLISQRFGYIGRVVVITLLFTLFAVLADRLLLLLRSRALRWA